LLTDATSAALLRANIKDSGVRFDLSRERENYFRSQRYAFGFSDSNFGEIVYRRTYSRVKPDGTQEDWYDTILRVINGVFTIRKWWFTIHNIPWDEAAAQERALSMAISALQMKWLPPGRGLYVQGTDYIYERGSMALYNCAYVEVNDISKDIPWLMDALMCGVGVGFGAGEKPQVLRSIDPEQKLLYSIPDSREGWVESIKLLLQSYLPQYASRRVEFDYSQIRPYGSLIRGFGGIASGPEPLRLVHERMRGYCEDYINGRANWTQLVANLANASGVCVVVGNVRRSAEIYLGSPNDDSFLNLKNYNLYPERMSIGWMSNNSCRFRERNDFLRISAIAERIRDNGEPGIYNQLNVTRYGRYGDETYGPDKATGMNPCSEIPLESYEVCNLAEVFPSRCSTRKEFLNACADATLYCSTVSLYPTHSPDTNAVVARNRRIGVSITGIAEWVETWGVDKCIRWMKDGYHHVRTVNKEVNAEAGVPASIRVTTIKPSGSVSQLAGVPSGMHFPTFSYAIRRIVMDRSSPIAAALKAANYRWEPLVEFLPDHEVHPDQMYFEKYQRFAPNDAVKPYASRTSIVFECPIKQGQARPATEVSSWEQFALLACLQREWADNSVSCTIYFNPETEGPQIAHMLAYFIPVIKSVSLLPHSDNGAYAQMPYEGISETEYLERVRELRKIDWQVAAGSDGDQYVEMYCASDRCQLIFK
jgi:ribonucleoside-diphosphate reductase alpha chain